MIGTMNVFVKTILISFIAAAMTITLIVNSGESQATRDHHLSEPAADVSNYKRPVSRFLQQSRANPRAADHCHKDNDVCSYISAGIGRNTTCCNNKCIDLGYEHKNCGACKKKCAFTESCCRGECVSLAYDKRHCGSCNNRCMVGGYCIYGICDYA